MMLWQESDKIENDSGEDILRDVNYTVSLWNKDLYILIKPKVESTVILHPMDFLIILPASSTTLLIFSFCGYILWTQECSIFI